MVHIYVISYKNTFTYKKFSGGYDRGRRLLDRYRLDGKSSRPI